MTTNYVEIQIKASDTAKPDLTSLKAQLDALGAKVETAKVNVDDTAGQAQLLAWNAKLAALNAKVANPKISISGAAKAEADIAAIDLAMKSMDNSTAGVKSRLLSLGGAAASLTGVGDAMTAASGDASMFQKVMAGAGLATGLLEPVVAGATVAVGGLAAGLVSAGAGLGVFGIVAKSVFTEASTAATAYAAAQKKFDTATTSKQRTAALQAEKAAFTGLSEPVKSLAIELGNAKNMWQNFTDAAAPGVVGVLSQGIGILTDHFGLLNQFLAPVEAALSHVMAQLNQGLNSSGFKSFLSALAANTGPAIEKIATAIGHVIVGIGGILKAFMPVSQGMLSGIDKITGEFAKWGETLSSHTGFQSLMSTFQSETPLAVAVLKNLAVVIKNVGSAMAGMATGSNSKMLLQVLGPLSGIIAKLSQNQDLVRIALYFLAAADAGKKLSNTVQGIQSAFGVFKTGASALQDLSAGFSNSAAAASSATGIFGTIGGKISTIGSALASAGSSVASFVAGMVKQLARAAVATGVWIAEHAVAAASFIAENVAMAVSATAAFIAENAATLGIIAGIALLVAGIVLLATHWSQVWSGIKSVALDAWHFIDGSLIQPLENGIGDLVSWIQSHWQLLATILATVLLGPVGGLVAFLATHWSQVTSDVSTLVTAVENFFKSLFSTVSSDATGFISSVVSLFTALPGKILSALSSFGSLLVNAGKSLIDGLINGIASMGSTLVNAIIDLIPSPIRSVVTAALGILSPSKVFHGYGVNIVQGLINGVSSQTPALKGQMSSMAATVSGTNIGGPAGGAGGAGAGGGAYGGKLQLELTSSGDQFLVWLRNSIRVKGGNVQSVLGTG